jgi:hypothetical protein
MSGQSAHLSLKEARAAQERIQCSGSQAKTKESDTGVKESHRKSTKKM